MRVFLNFMDHHTELYLLRHTPVHQAKGLCYGELDIPVAESFEQDFQKILLHLDEVGHFSHLFTSPLQRCLVLSENLSIKWSQGGKHPQVHVLDELKELSFGRWEGLRWNDIDPIELETWSADFVNRPPPGGESFVQLSHRVAVGFQRIQSIVEKSYQSNNRDPSPSFDSPRILCITHGGWIRSLMCHLMDIPLSSAFKLNIDYGSLIGFSFRSQIPCMTLMKPCLLNRDAILEDEI